MPVIAAYFIVIFIWSTTPLGIQWSGESVGYELGVALRMLIGLLLLIVVIRLFRLALPWTRHYIKVYLAGGIPLFLAMSSVYWSVQYVPTGWIAVLFGLTPVFTSFFALILLAENSFTRGKNLGMLLGIAGLTVVFWESVDLQRQAWMGVAGICFASLVHSLGSVLLKKLKPGIHPISVTTGSLIIATPLFAFNSLLQGLPDSIPARSLGAIIYLAVLGTAIGFPLYFYCLQRMRAEKVALITLVTPVSALLLGAWLNDEPVSQRTWLGTALILGGLSIYEYGKYLAFKGYRGRNYRSPL